MHDPSRLPPPSASVATPSAFAVAATSILPPPEVMAAPIWHSWHYGSAPAEDKPPPKIPDPIPDGAATTVDGLLAADYSAAYDYAIALGAAKIGAVLGGSLPNGHVPIGVDLDDCRNRETGEITAWAQDPIASFDSYTEVSPSGKGVKIFAVIAAEDIPAIQDAIRRSRRGNGSTDCRIWKWLTTKGKVHGPAIELFISKRWFTYTGHHVVGTPTEWRKLRAATIIDLIDRLGPAFLAADPSKRAPSLPLPPPPSPGPYPSPPPPPANDDHSAATPIVPIDLSFLPDPALRARIETAAERCAPFRKRLSGDYSGMGDASGSGIKFAFARTGTWAGLSREDIDDLTRYHPDTAASFEKEGERGQDNTWAKIGADAEREATTFAHVDSADFEDPLAPAVQTPGSTSTASRLPFSILSLTELEQRPKQRDVIAGLIAEQRIAVAGGVPKGGKTHLAVSIAYSIAAGVPFAGHAVDPAGASVLYWAGEGVGGLGARFAANREHLGVSDRGNVRVITGPLCLGDPASVTAFITTVRAPGFRPKMVIVDTLARAMPGLDENSSRDMGMAIAGADLIKDTFGCAVLIIAHTGKDATRGLRGSSALHGALDVAFRVDPAPGGLIAFTMTDSKESELTPPIFFELRKIADSVVPVVSSRASAIGPGGALPGPEGLNETLALDTLKAAISARKRHQTWHQQGLMPGVKLMASEDHQEVPANVFLSSLAKVAATLAEWREMFIAQHTGKRRDMKVQNFDRARKRLESKGLVIIAGEWVQLAAGLEPPQAQGFFPASGSMDEEDEQ